MGMLLLLVVRMSCREDMDGHQLRLAAIVCRGMSSHLTRLRCLLAGRLRQHVVVSLESGMTCHVDASAMTGNRRRQTIH